MGQETEKIKMAGYDEWDALAKCETMRSGGQGMTSNNDAILVAHMNVWRPHLDDDDDDENDDDEDKDEDEDDDDNDDEDEKRNNNFCAI